MAKDLVRHGQQSQSCPYLSHWIREVTQVFIALSYQPRNESLRVLVAEKEKISETKSEYSCKIFSSAEIEAKYLLDAMENDRIHELFHHLHLQHEEYPEKFSILLEISNVRQRLTSTFNFYSDCLGRLQINEKRKEKVRLDGINAVMQIRSISNVNDMLETCVALHDFFYKIRAFSVVGNIKFSAAAGEMDFTTEFASSDEFSDINGWSILSTTRHFFKNSLEGRLNYESSGRKIMQPTKALQLHCHDLQFELLTACFDSGEPECQSETNIYVYLSSSYGPFHGNLSSSCIGPLFPFMKVGLAINEIDVAPDLRGSVAPDAVMRAHRPSNFPKSFLVLLRVTLNESTASDENTRLFELLKSNIDSVLLHNTASIQAAFLHVAKLNLSKYRRQKSCRKISSDLEQAISMTITSVTEILSLTGSTSFRKTCHSLFGVNDTGELGVALTERLLIMADMKQESLENRKRPRDDDEGEDQDEQPEYD